MTRLSLRIADALRLLAKRLLASYAYDKFKDFIAVKYGVLREAGEMLHSFKKKFKMEAPGMTFP